MLMTVIYGFLSVAKVGEAEVFADAGFDPAPLLSLRIYLALMLHRQVNRPVISEIRRLPEARRIQAICASEDANIFGALVARESVDVGDDLVFFSSLLDECLRAVADCF